MNPLIEKWLREADQYQSQVEEARKAGTPHGQMLTTVRVLRACAKELEHQEWVTGLHAKVEALKK